MSNRQTSEAMGKLTSALMSEHPDHEHRTDDEIKHCNYCNPVWEDNE